MSDTPKSILKVRRAIRNRPVAEDCEYAVRILLNQRDEIIRLRKAVEDAKFILEEALKEPETDRCPCCGGSHDGADCPAQFPAVEGTTDG